jgi:hypothetical protein
MNSKFFAKLINCVNGEIELAPVIQLRREIANTQIDRVWWTEIDRPLRPVEQEPDRHWDWRELVSRQLNKPTFDAIAIQTADRAVQGAMIYRIDAKSALADGQYSVFVDRLASAPRNRASLVADPRFREVGKGLLSYAIATSYAIGFSGRVNLFAVANVEFYVKLGFQETAIGNGQERLYELPALAALDLLKQRGLINE